MKNFDFYTIQICVDGFGNDTVVDSVWKTKEEAEKEIERAKNENYCDCLSFEIVGGFFGKELDLAFN